jgi:hypothetical protein
MPLAGSAKWGSVERTRDRHLDYFLRLAEDAEPKLRLTEQAIWVERLAVEHDNLRTALDWGLTTAAQPVLQNLNRPRVDPKPLSD